MNKIHDFFIDLLLLKYDTELNKIKEVPLRLTSFTQGVSNIFGTFEENLNIKNNEQYELTFSIFQYCNDTFNPFWPYIVNDRKLRLYLDDIEENFIDFYIVDITPTTSLNNVKYTVKCQDAFSYDLSKTNIDLYFSTEDETVWGTNVGPKPIDKLVDKLFELANITEWKINPAINNVIFPFDDNMYYPSSMMSVSLDITSTPYNILVSIADLFNAIMIKDYKNKIIDFKNKEKIHFRGFELKPSCNLNSFSYQSNSENLYNIVHVLGGETSTGEYVSLMPTLPASLRTYLIENENWKGEQISEIKTNFFNSYSLANDYQECVDYFNILEKVKSASSFLYDFTYWLEKDIIDQNIYDVIEDSLSITLRDINLRLLCYNHLYYDYMYKYNQIFTQIETIVSSIAAEEYNYANTTENSTVNFMAKSLLKSFNDEEYLQIFKFDNTTFNDIDDINKIFDPTKPFHYGYFNNLDQSYYLPSFIDLCSLNTEGQHITDLLAVDLNENLDPVIITCTCDKELNTLLYSGEDFPFTSRFALYRKIDENFKINENLDLEGLYLNNIDVLQKDLNNLFNDDFLFYAISLYGSNFLDQKITELRNKKFEYENELKTLHDDLIELVENTLNKNNITITYAISIEAREEMAHEAMAGYTAENIKYSELLDRRNTLLIYLGGAGIKEGSEYQGYYDVFIDCLETINNNYNNIEIISYEGTTLTDCVSKIQKEQKDFMSDFYSRFHGIIREVNYSDENQLEEEGLFASAVKQFFNYKTPTESYNTSHITTDDLVSSDYEVQIGDKIKIYQNNLFNVKSKKRFLIHIRNTSCSIQINDFVNKGIILQDSSGERSIKGEVISVKQDPLYIILEVLLSTEIDYIHCYNTLINYKNKMNIESITNCYDNKPAELRVTGINYSLRDTIKNLTIEKFTIVNKIIDKMLFMFK